jgi:hypothetical protein
VTQPRGVKLHDDAPKVPRQGVEGKVQYRLYFFSGDNHIEKSHEFEATDDEHAIRISEGWREGRTIELWRRNRRVKRWD